MIQCKVLESNNEEGACYSNQMSDNYYKIPTLREIILIIQRFEAKKQLYNNSKEEVRFSDRRIMTQSMSESGLPGRSGT